MRNHDNLALTVRYRSFLLVKCLIINKNNICLLGDMEFLFECWNQYLTRSLRSVVRYRVELSKKNSISPRAHVCILHMSNMFMHSEVYMYVSLKDDIRQLFYLAAVCLHKINMYRLTSLCACFQLLWDNLIETSSDHEVVPPFWPPCSHVRRPSTAVLTRNHSTT